MLYQTPTVDFDANIKSHRMAVASFLKRNAWSDTDLRFTYDSNYLSLVDQVKAQLLEWYLNQDANS